MYKKLILYSFFFSWWCNALAGNLALIIKNSELTSISSFGEICISLNVKYLDLSSRQADMQSRFFLCLTDQAIQYLLAALYNFWSSPFLLAFPLFVFFSLGLFFAYLDPKFNLPKDDCSLLLKLTCHMTHVCNFHVRHS